MSVLVKELYHTGCPIRLMDEQSGQLHARGNIGESKGGGGMYGHGPTTNGFGAGDKGGASRFFQQFSPDVGAGFKYQAKASRAERNKGLEGMPTKGPDAHNLSSNACGHCGLRVKANGSGQKCECGELREVVKLDAPTNSHPTVKPIALMRYLCRLITRPGGTILDPFCGSGSTGCAAVQEGFDFIGIEKEPEYAEIARRRIAYWSQPEEVRAKENGKAPTKKRTTYGFKSTDVERRCPEHGEPIPSGSTTYKCGCAKVWYKTGDSTPQDTSSQSSNRLESSTLF